MEMSELGLIYQWIKNYIPDKRQCLEKNKKNNLKRLGLHNFTGAFVVLGTGTLISLIVFICEQIYFCTLPLRTRNVQSNYLKLTYNRRKNVHTKKRKNKIKQINISMHTQFFVFPLFIILLYILRYKLNKCSEQNPVKNNSNSVLCGKVLKINCGNGPVEAVVITCGNCWVDMIDCGDKQMAKTYLVSSIAVFL